MTCRGLRHRMSDRPRPLATALDAAVAVAGLWVAFAVAQTWGARLRHPYDLEWMEGGMLAHAWRLQHGLPLYPDPGPDWMPYVYPPGYAALLAAAGRLTGLDYPVGRALSIAGVTAAAAAIAVAVRRQGGSLALGVAVAAVFLGCYPASGAFYDLVRNDGVAVGLLAWAIVVGLQPNGRAPERAGLLLAAAFAVKHHSAAYGLPLALGIWARDGWRAAARFTAAAAVPAGLFTLAAEFATDGRFLAWILGVPASHPMVGDRLFPGALIEAGGWLLPAAATCALALALPLPRAARAVSVALGAAAAAAVTLAPVPKGIPTSAPWAAAAMGFAVGLGGAAAAARLVADGRTPRWTWVYGAGVGAVAWITAGLMRAHHGGFVNVWIPLHWAIALGFGVSVVALRRRFPGPVAHGTTAALLAAQLLWLGQRGELDRLRPTAADVAAGDAVVAQVRDGCGDGPVLSPWAPWIAVQAGHAPSWHLIALWDVDHPGSPFTAHRASLKQAFAEHRWACVVDGGNGQLGFGAEASYPVSTRFRLPVPAPGASPDDRAAAKAALLPKTGWRVRPTALRTPARTEAP
jgi:hypothetical protein